MFFLEKNDINVRENVIYSIYSPKNIVIEEIEKKNKCREF